jgi:magnesium transporter
MFITESERDRIRGLYETKKSKDFVFDFVLTENEKYVIIMDNVFVAGGDGNTIGSIWEHTYIFNELIKESLNKLGDTITESVRSEVNNVIEEINEQITDIDSRLQKTEDKSILSEIEFQKRKLIELRKIVIPMRDITVQLENAETPFIHEHNYHYFSNLKFLCESVLEEIDASKQILDGMSNLYYAAQGQRMNEIMKILTVVSAIFIPLTFIAGVYGMNFVFMPELKYTYGYYTIVGIMFMIGLSLLLFFWKRGWLKR